VSESGESPAAARVAELEAYDAVGDPPRPQLLALVELAAHACQVPCTAVNLITASEQVSVATYGWQAQMCSIEDSMCAAILDDGEPVFVPDASCDPRLSGNPFVDGRLDSIRFYAASQLITPAGVAIGTLCLFDRQPRILSEEQRSALTTLADRVVDVLELGRRTAQLEVTLLRLRAAREELRRSNQQLAAFAGQAAHDLRNPLTSVSMSLQMLAEQPSVLEDDDARWMVERALGGTGRMDSLIGELLGYAQVGGELRTGPVDLAALVDQLRADLDGALAGACLLVEGTLPVVPADRTQLAAVLANLVGNAVTFTRPVREPVVTVSARPVARGWRIEVADNGPGVPAEDRERVFEPLVRRDRSTEGAGLGLSICRRIVRAHGGSIGMADGPAGGALVWLELPADLADG
jgi:signal transduction histidine kinase